MSLWENVTIGERVVTINLDQRDYYQIWANDEFVLGGRLSDYDHEELYGRQKLNIPQVIEAKHEKDINCVCRGGAKYGHKNQAGGYCCKHFGNTCGYHDKW